MIVLRFVVGLLLLCVPAAAQETFPIRGVVTDLAGSPLEGATIAIAEREASAPITARADGSFEITGLRAGKYTITAILSGFRSETRTIVLPDQFSKPVTFRLRIGVLIEAMVVRSTPEETVHNADAIAHVRLDGLAPPLPCSELTIVSAVHNVAVLEVFKGSLPKHIQVLEYNRGVCTDGANPVSALGGPISRYAIGGEYIVFLTKDGTRFGGLGTSEDVLPVRGGVVTTQNFHGLPATLSVQSFKAALRRLLQ